MVSSITLANISLLGIVISLLSNWNSLNNHKTFCVIRLIILCIFGVAYDYFAVTTFLIQKPFKEDQIVLYTGGEYSLNPMDDLNQGVRKHVKKRFAVCTD